MMIAVEPASGINFFLTEGDKQSQGRFYPDTSSVGSDVREIENRYRGNGGRGGGVKKKDGGK